MVKRVVGMLLVLLVATMSGQTVNQSAVFDPSPLIGDFQQLLVEMSDHYAGLEFAVEQRKMNLPQLRGEAEANLRKAGSEREARRVIQRFLDAFGDGHLEIEWPDQKGNQPDTAQKSICGILGYDSRLKPGLDFSGLPAFSSLSSPAGRIFPGGLLRLPSGKVVGVIRIGLFSEHAFPELCQEAVKALKISDGSVCDNRCSDGLDLKVADSMTGALSERAKELRAAGAVALLIDITHNGGGSDWVEAACRELSSVPLHDSRMAFLRHPHWTENLTEELQNVETDLKEHRGPEDLLNQAAITLQSAIQETRSTCRLTDVWITGKVSCSMLVKDRLFVSGVADYAKPGSYVSLASKTTLFKPLRYGYQEESNRLPVYVLVDRDTWSSAEYFAAILQDNHAATIIGESTGGAGCGYTNGGIPTKLRNSGAIVKMPDCIRFRTNGSNEVNGIIPDLLVAWPRMASDYQRAMALMPVLDKSLAQPK